MYASLITKEYLNGRLAITTDRLGGFRTGHGTTPISYWSKLLQWTGKALDGEALHIGVIKSEETYYKNYLKSIPEINFSEITTE